MNGTNGSAGPTTTTPASNGTATAPSQPAANVPQATTEKPNSEQAQAPAKGGKKSGKDEKKELMEKMQPPKGSKPIDMATQKGDRWAKDPVTGQDVLIRDPSFKGAS